jgi:ribose-phosphate pyrophosphokinase
MMRPILFAMPGGEPFAARLATLTECEQHDLLVRRFPDGESYVRLLTDVKDRDVIFVCMLDRPDDKILPLYFAASIARELGARRIGLVIPYLPYMRQDARFRDGEGITSAHFGRLVSGFCDWLVTVDPHLHRHHDLAEVYSVATTVVHAAPEIAQWIAANVRDPIIVGPDSESEQWTAEVAKNAGCPYTVLQKTRRGDRDVEIAAPDLAGLPGRTPVLVDDIVSTGRTMIAAASHFRTLGAPPPICIAVHPLFSGDAYVALQAAGVDRIASCNTVTHSSNRIDVCGRVAAAVEETLRSTPNSPF